MSTSPAPGYEKRPGLSVLDCTGDRASVFGSSYCGCRSLDELGEDHRPLGVVIGLAPDEHDPRPTVHPKEVSDLALGRPVLTLGHLETTACDTDDVSALQLAPSISHAVTFSPRMACVDSRAGPITRRVAMLPGVDGTHTITNSELAILCADLLDRSVHPDLRDLHSPRCGACYSLQPEDQGSDKRQHQCDRATPHLPPSGDFDGLL